MDLDRLEAGFELRNVGLGSARQMPGVHDPTRTIDIEDVDHIHPTADLYRWDRSDVVVAFARRAPSPELPKIATCDVEISRDRKLDPLGGITAKGESVAGGSPGPSWSRSAVARSSTDGPSGGSSDDRCQ